jgi:hypothetical protein
LRLDFVRALQAVSTVLGDLKALELHVMDRLTSMRICITLEVRFRALLNQDVTQQLEVVRV